MPEEGPQPFIPPRVHKGMEVAAALEQDAQLMLRVRAGDDTSFALLLDRHRRPVCNHLYRMVQNQAISEELAQEVFLRVYRSRATYEVSAKFTTWLYRISTHVALNWIRNGKKEKGQKSLDETTAEGREQQVEDLRPTTEQEMLQRARVLEVRQAIEGLPEKQRAAVLMHKYEDLDYAQIAKALSCSESALKSLLFRAYETLRSRLAHLV
jgi:RNA polymerase sigma-70 factor (ECF subfamily)